MAVLNQKTFFELCNSFPEIILKMRERALKYEDPWKQFKKKVLEEVEYFKPFIDDPYFIEEVHYHLQEQYIDKGTEIMGPSQIVNSISFIVQGIVDLKVSDEDGQDRIIETLEQGDILG